MAALFDLPAGFFVCDETVVVVFGAEGLNKDYISVSVAS